MDRDPRVSVIMPFLNVAKFIREAIEIVLAQTYDGWELLLVDDGSSDGSTEIALEYAEQYPQVRYLEHSGHQNRGASVSRNLGIRCARGEYIAFLDADDVWLPHKLEQQVPLLDSQPEAGMLYGVTQYWYSWTGNPEDRQRDYVSALGIQPNTLVEPLTLLALFLREEFPTPCTCSVLLRREVVKSIGGFEDVFQRVFTDQAFYAKVCLKTPVFVSDECWDRYRQHPDSSCSVAEITGQLNATRLIFFDWLTEYLTAQGLDDPGIWRTLRNKQWQYRHPALNRLIETTRHPVKPMRRLLNLIARRALPSPVYCWLKSCFKIP
jgi:glycosyltransferase involved in cell wall biosynthesis